MPEISPQPPRQSPIQQSTVDRATKLICVRLAQKKESNFIEIRKDEQPDQTCHRPTNARPLPCALPSAEGWILQWALEAWRAS